MWTQLRINNFCKVEGYTNIILLQKFFNKLSVCRSKITVEKCDLFNANETELKHKDRLLLWQSCEYLKLKRNSFRANRIIMMKPLKWNNNTIVEIRHETQLFYVDLLWLKKFMIFEYEFLSWFFVFWKQIKLWVSTSEYKKEKLAEN